MTVIYIKTMKINDDIKDEMECLNKSFGIGVIKLSPYQDDRTILFLSRKNELDY